MPNPKVEINFEVIQSFRFLVMPIFRGVRKREFLESTPIVLH